MNDIAFPKGEYPTTLAMNTAFQELADAVSRLLKEPLPSWRHIKRRFVRPSNCFEEGDFVKCPKACHGTDTDKPIVASFHDGMVHDPLGSGAYAFWLARKISDQIHSLAGQSNDKPPDVLVELNLVDTAPVSQLSIQIGGIQYQRALRDVPDIRGKFVPDYYEVMGLLSSWANIPFTVKYQQDMFSHHTMPQATYYLIKHHSVLGHQLSPKYGTLGLRAACRVPDCFLSEKHGQLNKHEYNDQMENSTSSYEAEIVFQCPFHGPHTIHTRDSAQLSRLEANAPARNLIRSMSHLLDVGTHHVRVTGSDYAGTYQEVFLYRQLTVWSTLTGLSAGRTPHILYAPLIVD